MSGESRILGRGIHWVTFLAVLAVVMVGSMIGCSERDTELDKAYAWAIEYGNSEKPEVAKGYSDYVVNGWEDGMAMLHSRKVTTTPHLLWAYVFPREGKWNLFLMWLELDNDSCLMRIESLDRKSGSSLLEEYPLPPDPMSSKVHLWHAIPYISISLRQNSGESEFKDERKWNDWLAAPRLDNYPPAPIWISLPAPPDKQVRICIVDKEGCQSNWVDLHVAD